MSKTAQHNAVDNEILRDSDVYMEHVIGGMLDRDEEVSVEEWIAFLKDTDYALKIPMKTNNYMEPYYAWWESSSEKVVLARGHTADGRHDEDETYLRTMFGFYDPIPVDKDVSSVIEVDDE